MRREKAHPTERPAFIESFAIELIHDYFQHYRDKPPKQPRGKFGFCYIGTVFGTLEIPLDNLLYITACMLERVNLRKPDHRIAITDDVVHAAWEVLIRIPDYMGSDLAGMIMEADLELCAIHQGKLDVGRLFREKLRSPTEDGLRLRMLRTLLLEGLGVFSLEMDDIRVAFEEIVSRRGVAGKSWKKFLTDHFKEKKKPGRPRSTKYDLLLEKRTANPKMETYGKLAREFDPSTSVPREVLLNRIKSAAAYRRKKSPAGKKIV